MWKACLSPSMIFTAFLTLTLLAAAAGESLTAYEALEEYGFPVGLLPEGVLGYELDRSTGKFSAHLNGSCSFSIDSYKLKYKSTISGYISTGKLSDLRGVSVKIVLFWVNIVEVLVVGDDLEFSVGIASADFPIFSFDERPQCGCGFDCITRPLARASY